VVRGKLKKYFGRLGRLGRILSSDVSTLHLHRVGPVGRDIKSWAVSVSYEITRERVAFTYIFFYLSQSLFFVYIIQPSTPNCHRMDPGLLSQFIEQYHELQHYK
jgi:hypothetical protein